MSRHCQVAGAVPGSGHTTSRPHRRTERRFDVDVQTERCWAPSLGRTVTPRVSPRGIRTIDRSGIDAVLAAIRARGGSL